MPMRIFLMNRSPQNQENLPRWAVEF